ncbi:MAG: molybdate ABC transporter permease subunit [Rhodothermales bacterium]|nr:molybdate ABC transporter permease subunit [Rhodothermales bacterium]
MLTTAEWEVVLLSMRVASVAVLISLPFAVALAYALSRRRFPATFLVENVVQIPLVLPPVVTGIILLYALGPRSPIGRIATNTFGLDLTFTWIAASLAAAVVSFPILVQAMRIAFEQIDPVWEEACLVYGGGRWEVFRFVIMPLASRGVLASVLLALGRAVGEFGATIVVAGNIPGETRTIPLAIFTEMNRVGGEAAAIRLVIVAVAISVVSLAGSALLSRRLYRPDRISGSS